MCLYCIFVTAQPCQQLELTAIEAMNEVTLMGGFRPVVAPAGRQGPTHFFVFFFFTQFICETLSQVKTPQNLAYLKNK